MGMLFFSRVLRTPMCASPFAPPLPKAKPIFGNKLIAIFLLYSFSNRCKVDRACYNNSYDKRTENICAPWNTKRYFYHYRWLFWWEKRYLYSVFLLASDEWRHVLFLRQAGT